MLKRLTKRKLSGEGLKRIKILEEVRGGVYPWPTLPWMECECNCYYHCGDKPGSDDRLYTGNDEIFE